MKHLAMFMVLMLTVSGCSSDEPTERSAPSTSQQAPQSPQFVIDVRSAAEFDTGHIEGAVNIPTDEICTRIAEVTEDTDQAIVLYCRSGGRAGIALRALQELGYTQVENAGGYRSLKEKLGQ